MRDLLLSFAVSLAMMMNNAVKEIEIRKSNIFQRFARLLVDDNDMKDIMREQQSLWCAGRKS